ncbi:hypothetical protein C2W62_26690 [Candidatus Entotheonella serta]|nr:hypothetical protein C2W62_26690 [Candidatus Entotheonella serta]
MGVLRVEGGNFRANEFTCIVNDTITRAMLSYYYTKNQAYVSNCFPCRAFSAEMIPSVLDGHQYGKIADIVDLTRVKMERGLF